MHHQSVGFIGGGRITRIFLSGWQKAGKLPERVVVSDVHAEVLSRLNTAHPAVQITADNAAAAAQDLVFLAVHPPVMVEVLNGIRAALRPEAVVVSLAPKFTLGRLRELLGGFGRLARVIPNAPSLMGLGYNPMVFAAELGAAERAEIAAWLEPLGEHPEVAEEKLEAYALLSAMGPTYFWFQWQALREVALGLGLTEGEIVPAMKRMVCGGARTLLESGLSPAEVMDLIPVKPLAEMEAQVTELYRTRLPALHQKIKP
ncbi:NAD(P)-binding domain-containing protein [Fontisphaera persica]|uniref:pyrroline-5-carboxylate reductase family protein n=1 Tax=Fontisphaera persica TaxID=2974023 RepID=UPI0024C08949|nr:NAD(P)-binding domain-containing protein [Fontisphaera persica]WCJ59386.1 NAD(P)-binding domain-containing protein [Fontisphaera persica]